MRSQRTSSSWPSACGRTSSWRRRPIWPATAASWSTTRLQTYDPAIYAVGECVQHRRQTFGLVAPLWEQARICAQHIAEIGVSRFSGAINATQLKVSGIEVFSAGDFSEQANRESLVLSDKRRGVYKRVVLEGNKVCGAVLFGDVQRGFAPARPDRRSNRHRADTRSVAVRFAGCRLARERWRSHSNYLSVLRRGLRRARHARARAARWTCAAIPRIPPIAASCASRATRSAKPWASKTGCCIRMVRGERVTWDAAIATVAGAFRDCIRKHGPESVAFYVSGQLLTEDYYVANKLMKGYVGAANIDTNSRLCMASAVAGHKRAFGEDVVPVSYEDLEHDRSHRAGRLQHRVVPSRSSCSASWRRASSGRTSRSSRWIRGAPPPRSSPICTCRWRRAPTCTCSMVCSSGWPSTARWIAPSSMRTRMGWQEALACSPRRRRQPRRYRARLRARRGATCSGSTKCSLPRRP